MKSIEWEKMKQAFGEEQGLEGFSETLRGLSAPSPARSSCGTVDVLTIFAGLTTYDMTCVSLRADHVRLRASP